MHKPVLAALVSLTALLASCRDQVTTTPVDPATLTVTSSGALQNYTPDREYAVSYDTGKGVIQVGSVRSDKTVSVKITAEQGSQNMNTLSAWVSRMQTAKCEVSGLTIADTSYRAHTTYPFTKSDGTKMYAVMQRAAAVGDGTYNWDRTHLFYVKAAGSMKGTNNCSGLITTFDIELQPGWNVIHQTFNENPTDLKIKNLKFTTGAKSTTVSGNWYAYQSQ